MTKKISTTTITEEKNVASSSSSGNPPQHSSRRPSFSSIASSPSSPSPAEDFERRRIQPALDRRRELGSLRSLTPYRSHGDGRSDYWKNNIDSMQEKPTSASSAFSSTGFLDFSSNDYLGLAQSRRQHGLVQEAYHTMTHHQHHEQLGSTGSRLLTGNSAFAHELEQRLAAYHQQPAALLCNSGYDANLAVLSCLAAHGALLVLDELCHNSIQMGVRMGKREGHDGNNRTIVRQFQHNNVLDLERILQEISLTAKEAPTNKHGSSDRVSSSSSSSPSVVIVVESIYSMDGDAAPLQAIFQLALRYNACVMVDEAHGLGVYGGHGMGLLEELHLQNHPSLLCSVFTYGKAAGCHGAVVCASPTFVEFLFNFGRPIVYSTSLPMHSLVCIACAYETMRSNAGHSLRLQVLELVQYFRRLLQDQVLHQAADGISLVESQSPIQALIVPGNQQCVDFCRILNAKSHNTIRLFPIRSPTVPKGEERARIVLHAFNTSQQVQSLVSLIQLCLNQLGLLKERFENNCSSCESTTVVAWQQSKL